MGVERYRHPAVFYGLSLALPWTLWFLAAHLSHVPGGDPLLISLLGMAGLASPVAVAFALIAADRGLRRDVADRLFGLRAIRPGYLFLTLFLMLASILLAQAVSLAFGYSASQFRLAQAPAFSAGIFSPWFLLIVAPILEELAWHSYGTDCLRRQFSLFATSMMFALFWALWHLPLGFIKGYYQSNLAESGAVYALNFAVSLFPYVLLMNWLYYRTGRNILVAIVFHLTANISNTIFATHPDSKIIQTFLLLALTTLLLWREPRFFFARTADAKA